jgi:hypothetical protein
MTNPFNQPAIHHRVLFTKEPLSTLVDSLIEGRYSFSSGLFCGSHSYFDAFESFALFQYSFGPAQVILLRSVYGKKGGALDPKGISSWMPPLFLGLIYFQAWTYNFFLQLLVCLNSFKKCKALPRVRILKFACFLHMFLLLRIYSIP